MKQICSLLIYFGLDVYDCKVYLCLVNHGTISASTISAKLNIERNKVYRILVKLKNQGLVESTFSNPILYHVDSIQKGLNEIIERKTDDLKNLKRLSKIIVNNFKENQVRKIVVNKPSLSIIQGRDNIYSRIARVIENSESNIFLCTTSHDLLNMYHSIIPEKIKIAKTNGNKINIITNYESEDIDQIISRINPTEFRYCEIPNSRILVEFGSQVIMSDLIKKSMSINELDDTVFHSTSNSMIDSMSMFCENLWKNSDTPKRFEHQK